LSWKNHAAQRVEHRVAALDRLRAGADDLDEQGLRRARVLADDLQQRVDARPHALVVGADGWPLAATPMTRATR
jgi:hypothetical protein